MKKLSVVLLSLTSCFFLSTAFAQTPVKAPKGFKPAVVFDMGGKFDKSFNEGVYNGVQKFKKETGIGYLEFEITNTTQRKQALERMVRRGANPIIGVGFGQASAIAYEAKRNPKIHFVLIDSKLKLPNVLSYTFKEQEGSFLAGMLAAMKSKTGKIGFIGGMDIPLIRKFQCGYLQGAKYENPKISVLVNYTGATAAAWADPTRGAELAKSQFDRGVDVVFAAAGATGLGVYQAAKDDGKYAIGVDSNQNQLHPGTMLTTVVKRVDVAAYNALKEALDGTWKSGEVVLGLKDKGIGLAMDKYNESLITPKMHKAIDEATKKIINGDIKVHDYMSDNSCKF